MELGLQALGLGNRLNRRRVLRAALGIGTAAVAGKVLESGASATSGPEFLYTTSNLNLRAKASSSGKILLVMPASSVVKSLMGFSNGYAKINYQGTFGWAASQYMEQLIPGEGTNNVDIVGEAVTSSTVNFRTGPTTGHGVYEVVKKGKKVQITALVSSGFRFVFVNNKWGWIYDQYLDRGKSEGPISFVTTSAVNLRKEPSTAAKIIKVVPKGATVIDYDLVMSNGYRGVDYKGTVGWIYDAYLDEK